MTRSTILIQVSFLVWVEHIFKMAAIF